jgi:hypothetical protein
MSMLQLSRVDQLSLSMIDWLWPGYIPAGKLTLLDGDPDRGKSLITVDLAARLSRGRALPDGTAGGPVVRSLFLQAEDDPHDTLRPRLEAANADFEHVFVLSRDDPKASPVRLPRDLGPLEEIIRTERIRLLVIDPLIAYLPPSICVSNDQVVRRALSRLAAMATRTGAAVVLVRHLNKQGRQKALYRGGGSIGIIGSARSALLVASHPSSKGDRVLTVTKSNLSEQPAALGYRVVANDAKQPTIEWTGPLPLSADDALNPPPPESPVSLGVVHATEWLITALRKGPRPATEIVEAAREAGISERTLERAKEGAKVASKLIYEKDQPKRWEWRLKKQFLPPLDNLE